MIEFDQHLEVQKFDFFRDQVSIKNQHCLKRITFKLMSDNLQEVNGYFLSATFKTKKYPTTP